MTEGSWTNCQAEEMPVWDRPVRIPGARRGRGMRPSGDVESGSSSGTADPTDKEGSASIPGLDRLLSEIYPELSLYSHPLTDMTRKTEPNIVKWTGECEAAFRKLKELLCSAPLLRTPNFAQTFIMQTDASNRGGALLSQTKKVGDQPVAYFSKKLLPREERYLTVEKECLAIKLEVQAFRVYVLSRPFVVQTDHRALEWLNRVKEKNRRLTR